MHDAPSRGRRDTAYVDTCTRENARATSDSIESELAHLELLGKLLALFVVVGLADFGWLGVVLGDDAEGCQTSAGCRRHFGAHASAHAIAAAAGEGGGGVGGGK
jgi:hypothetical protein